MENHIMKYQLPERLAELNLMLPFDYTKASNLGEIWKRIKGDLMFQLSLRGGVGGGEDGAR